MEGHVRGCIIGRRLVTTRGEYIKEITMVIKTKQKQKQKQEYKIAGDSNSNTNRKLAGRRKEHSIYRWVQWRDVGGCVHVDVCESVRAKARYPRSSLPSFIGRSIKLLSVCVCEHGPISRNRSAI